RNRRAVDRGEREPDTGQYDSDRALFSVCGAAPVYRRAMLDDVAVDGQYLDEDFFAYFEDFDLSWRAQLRGWRFAYVPEATGRHFRGGSGGKSSTFILSCNHRNRLLVMLHNDTPAAFAKALPGILYTEVRATLHMLSLRPAALVKAWGDFFRLLPRHLARRRRIQRRRTVSWSELEQWFAPYDYRISTLLRRARQRAAVR
ncbi:MAG TPA: glycosyltransferase family 2 protein, partial [Actinomycetota bacterium]|nr:glycosyltransferase family 2 protein [Actinomycetota bacterium]